MPAKCVQKYPGHVTSVTESEGPQLSPQTAGPRRLSVDPEGHVNKLVQELQEDSALSALSGPLYVSLPLTGWTRNFT